MRSQDSRHRSQFFSKKDRWQVQFHIHMLMFRNSSKKCRQKYQCFSWTSIPSITRLRGFKKSQLIRNSCPKKADHGHRCWHDDCDYANYYCNHDAKHFTTKILWLKCDLRIPDTDRKIFRKRTDGKCKFICICLCFATRRKKCRQKY